jgi:hypothetical protein
MVNGTSEVSGADGKEGGRRDRLVGDPAGPGSDRDH